MSLMMFCCCTSRLKRRSTLSIDSRSRTLTSATRVTPFVAPRRRWYPMPNRLNELCEGPTWAGREFAIIGRK